MKRLNICIDIDGTITSPYHFLSYLNEMYNRDITKEEWTTVNWSLLYDSDIEGMMERFHKEYLHSYDEAELVQDVKEVIKELEQNNNLYFVTARGIDLKDITTNWLLKKELSHIDLYLIGSNYKIDKAKELNCHIFIEDNPINAIQLAKSGIKVLLIDTNYNKEIKHENITRVYNWIDIKRIIESND